VKKVKASSLDIAPLTILSYNLQEIGSSQVKLVASIDKYAY